MQIYFMLLHDTILTCKEVLMRHLSTYNNSGNGVLQNAVHTIAKGLP
jgi:hypothetical protein